MPWNAVGIAVLLSLVDAVRIKWVFTYSMLTGLPSLDRFGYLRDAYPSMVCFRKPHSLSDTGQENSNAPALCNEYPDATEVVIICDYDFCIRSEGESVMETFDNIMYRLIWRVRISRSLVELRSIVSEANKMHLFVDNLQLTTAVRNRVSQLCGGDLNKLREPLSYYNNIQEPLDPLDNTNHQ